MISPIQFDRFEVSLEKVLARLGYLHGRTELDEHTKELILREIDFAKKLLEPRQVIASSKILRPAENQVLLEPNLLIKSKNIANLLSECTVATGFAVTIGRHMEQKRDECIFNKEPFRAIVIDAIGSESAEELARITNEQLENEALHRGMAVTRRYSPGYGDWKISGQKEFLCWLSAESIGIKLTKTFQMLPEKSVSAILGVKTKL